MGVGYIVRIRGGKLDGLLAPLHAITRMGQGTALSPETLKDPGPLQLLYNPNQEALRTMVAEPEEIGPGERMYSTALCHFERYEEWNGLTMPVVVTLSDSDLNVGLRGGLVHADSFSSLMVNNENQTPVLSMGLKVIEFMPESKELLEQYQAEWPTYADGIKKSGVSAGLQYQLQFQWSGSTAGVGKVWCDRGGDVTVFLLLSGLSEGDELKALALGQEMTPFLNDAEVWKSLTHARPLLLTLGKSPHFLFQPVQTLAWVFFRRLGAL
jgi:hypothetical protein